MFDAIFLIHQHVRNATCSPGMIKGKLGLRLWRLGASSSTLGVSQSLIEGQKFVVITKFRSLEVFLFISRW